MGARDAVTRVRCQTKNTTTHAMRRRIPVALSAVLEKFQSDRVMRSMIVASFVFPLGLSTLDDSTPRLVTAVARFLLSGRLRTVTESS